MYNNYMHYKAAENYIPNVIIIITRIIIIS